MRNRILHLIQTSGPGGAENLFLNLACQTAEKYKTTAGLLKSGWLYKQLLDSGTDVTIIPSAGSFDVKLIMSLINLIRKEKIDLIQSHLLDMNFYSSIAARIVGVPHICTEHGDIHHTSNKLNLKTKFKAKAILKLSNNIVFVSNYTKQQFLKIARGSLEKTLVVYNGVDLEEYDTPVNIETKKKELGIRNNEIVVGNVANLYPVKGQIYLLHAAKEVIKKLPNTKFLIIGRGKLEQELKREASKIGILERVNFLGLRDDVKQLLKLMNVFVLTSLSEGLPLSLIEAMAMKVPVVATNVGGIPEVIRQNVNGFLVPAAAPEILASRIIQVLRDRSKSETFRIFGYKTVKEKFNFQNMIAEYIKLYSSNLSKNIAKNSCPLNV